MPGLVCLNHPAPEPNQRAAQCCAIAQQLPRRALQGRRRRRRQGEACRGGSKGAVEEEGGVRARQQHKRPLAGATMRAAGSRATNGVFRGTAPGWWLLQHLAVQAVGGQSLPSPTPSPDGEVAVVVWMHPGGLVVASCWVDKEGCVDTRRTFSVSVSQLLEWSSARLVAHSALTPCFYHIWLSLSNDLPVQC